ncbi:MAG: alpha-glucosidase [candidate division KSB1 bacterium]|nr:alpha-glucosidase [candidate division KSB1 bacterium]
MRKWAIVLLVVAGFLDLGCGGRKQSYVLEATREPFSFRLKLGEEVVFAEQKADTAASSLFYLTDKGPQFLVKAVRFEAGRRRLSATYITSDGRRATVQVTPQKHGGCRVSVRVEPAEGILGVGETLACGSEEHFHGLTERVLGNDDRVPRDPSVPVSLDRRGHHVEMITRGTISIYSPFYLSSAGYGLFVEGTWTGEFDMAAQRPDRVWFRFDGPSLSYHVFPSKSPERILEMYTSVAGRPFLPPRWAFGPWRWRDEHRNLDTLYDGTPYRGPINSQVYEDVMMMEKLDIPCSVYWIDRPWARGQWGYEAFEWDATRFPNARQMIRWLDRRGIKLLLWIAPWVVGDLAREALQRGYFLPSFRMAWLGIHDGSPLGSVEALEKARERALEAVRNLPPQAVAMYAGWRLRRRISPDNQAAVDSARQAMAGELQQMSPQQFLEFLLQLDQGRVKVDFTNPHAVRWWHRYLEKVLDDGVAGFKLDRSEEILPTGREVRAYDGRCLAELHNHYPVLYARRTYEITRKHRGKDFVLMPRAGYTGSQQYAVFWGGDAANTFVGLRNMIIGAQRAAILGFPVWGSDTGGYMKPTYREVLARWLAFSAFCPIMEVGPTSDRAPWDMPFEPRYDAEVIAIWRTYAKLHQHLQEYSYRYAREAHEYGHPIIRPMFYQYPQDPNAWEVWDQYFYGRDYLVAPLWQEGASERDVYIPAGMWIDYWNPRNVVQGPTTLRVACPLYKLPIYLRKDSKERILDLEGLYRESLEIASSPPELGDGSELRF